MGGVFTYRVVKWVFTDKVAFIQRSERTKGANVETAWNENIPEESERINKRWGQRSNRHLDHIVRQIIVKTLMLTVREIRNHWRFWAKEWHIYIVFNLLLL